MTLTRKIILVIVGITILFFLLLIWYKVTYSMDPVISYEINKDNESQKILIATQGSDYKNGVVEEIIDYLKDKPVYIKVIDVTHLKNVNHGQWDAIIVLHNWQMWKPDENARIFLEKYYSSGKIFVVETSGSGEEKIEGVDAITGASKMIEVPKHAKQINAWIKRQLSFE